MGIDKGLAAGRLSVISERTLWLVALLGGFTGILRGGYIFRHKTSKVEFWGLVVVSTIVWAVVIAIESLSV